MLYAIVARHREGSALRRAEVRPAHLERLQQLQDEGRLVLAGPFPAIDSEEPGAAGFDGSLIVAEFDSLQEAENWVGDDPYSTANIYHSIVIKPFCKVFPR